ncbi:MAG: hypothetical protein ACK413_02710 [Patescibacteria group bacterium]
MKKNHLDDHFFLYVGKINAFAIKDKDQHHISFLDKNKKLLKVGQLKVYCPIVIPFIHFKKLKLLNSIWPFLNKKLERDVPFEKAIEAISVKIPAAKKLLQYIEKWNKLCINNPDVLKKELWGANIISYKRSIFLQKEYEKEDISSLSPLEQVGITLGRIKASFIAMAPHYNVEGLSDDAFRPFKYHLPNIIKNEIKKILKKIEKKGIGINTSDYLLALRHYLMKEIPVDRYRFIPIFPSLLKKYIRKPLKEYKNWHSFKIEVVNKIKDPALKKIIKDIANAMKIDKEMAVFSGVMIYEKILRKLGKQALLNPRTAKRLLNNFEEKSKKLKRFFKNIDKKIRKIISPEEYKRLVKYSRELNIIEIINGKLGYYKFVPMIKDDKNFDGKFFPYGIIKTQKKVLYELLNKYKFLWKKSGLWFLRELKKLLKINPSLYTKWLVPFFEKKKLLIDDIYPLIDKSCYIYLEKLKKYEDKK